MLIGGIEKLSSAKHFQTVTQINLHNQVTFTFDAFVSILTLIVHSKCKFEDHSYFHFRFHFHFQGLRSVKQLSAHPTLKKLVLSFNQLEGLEDFHHMDSLEDLDISFNGLTTLEGLRSLTNLKTLNIRFCSV